MTSDVAALFSQQKRHRRSYFVVGPTASPQRHPRYRNLVVPPVRLGVMTLEAGGVELVVDGINVAMGETESVPQVA